MMEYQSGIWKPNLQNLCLDTYTQNFSINHPFLDTDTIGNRRVPKLIQETNVYAILRAPRIAGTEAIVMMVPYRSGKAADERGHTHYGVGTHAVLGEILPH